MRANRPTKGAHKGSGVSPFFVAIEEEVSSDAGDSGWSANEVPEKLRLNYRGCLFPAQYGLYAGIHACKSEVPKRGWREGVGD